MTGRLIAITFFLVTVIIHCHGHHGHPVLHQIEDIKKLPEVEWEPALQELLKSRIDARQARNSIDDAIIAALESLRKIMPTGDADLGIPPLDPLFISHAVIEFDHPLIQLDLTIDNTTVTDLSQFKIDKIQNDLDNLKADFGITLPQLDFVGIYDAKGKVPNVIDITGDGNFTLSLTGLSTWGTVTIASENNSEDGAVYISSLELDFTLEALKPDLRTSWEVDSVGDIMNDLISQNGPAYLEQMKPQINEYIASIFVGLANPILSHYTLKEILDYLGVTP